MNFAFIKDNICFNIVVFESNEIANAFKSALVQDGVLDDLIELPNGFAIGDTYINGEWTKQEIPESVHVPTEEERIEALEAAMSFMLGM